MIKLIISVLKRNRLTCNLLAAYRLWKKTSYLRRIGWFESYYLGVSVDSQKQEIPWFTYSAVHFLKSTVTKRMRVFEYGSGNSTFWWSRLVLSVVSCEHNKSWYDRIKGIVPSNVEYLYVELNSSHDYAKSILNYKCEFDIVVIDGRDRVSCAKNCLTTLRQDGVIIWDNSDRAIYQDGYSFLLKNGFKQLEFCGLGPVNLHDSCTSVFYRSDNCLGL